MLYVTAPLINDISANLQPTMPQNNACGGTAEVILDGRNLGKFSNWQYGPLPDSGVNGFSGCYAPVPATLTRGSHTITINHSGFAARVSGFVFGSRYDYWMMVPDSTRTITFSR